MSGQSLDRLGYDSQYLKNTKSGLSSYQSEDVLSTKGGLKKWDKEEEKLNEKRPRYCCCFHSVASICWTIVLAIACLVGGFMLGMVFHDRTTRPEPVNVTTVRCGTINPNFTAICRVCGESRLVRVSGAANGDCNGQYTITNLTSRWTEDWKDTGFVFERIAGGWGQLNRYIYWTHKNGWTIGDHNSLYKYQDDYLFRQKDPPNIESGDGWQGGDWSVGHPWAVEWPSNVTVKMDRCQRSEMNYVVS